MNQGTIGSIFTVIVFVSFVGVLFWAFSGRNKKNFDEAANLPFADEEQNKAKQQSTQKDQES
ncbi:CcoQ/FixQ family Cbb3-type cytochrome c oxidase assembly chaperone [Glaciecola sp. XM2]|jgi:cytochrome c oxidase cbb3-type subunit 4|uniref:cbb3-type cytochrome oxidase subunit 3 n=1 Tax=Glaciecola sp. XM2 TaxID=1914931 RepID=UPI001BDF58E8|nr:CcoQ/FixQ family Cbb3-type cytochrome c oxidase assembly chaperone [Glaciecola sp. XM2]MBT1449641.1 CcoQ/FixQ family Cbb3-type cytochrome c oxidase assembly chaperone [Glaciecola sp. XM2]